MGLTGGLNPEALDNTIRILLLWFAEVKLTYKRIRVGDGQNRILANCNILTKTQRIKDKFRTLELKHRNYKNNVYPYSDYMVFGRLLKDLWTCTKLERVNIQNTSPHSSPCKLVLSTWTAWTSTGGKQEQRPLRIGVANVQPQRTPNPKNMKAQ